MSIGSKDAASGRSHVTQAYGNTHISNDPQTRPDTETSTENLTIRNVLDSLHKRLPSVMKRQDEPFKRHDHWMNSLVGLLVEAAWKMNTKKYEARGLLTKVGNSFRSLTDGAENIGKYGYSGRSSEAAIIGILSYV
ncbi:hypothetical protein HOY80DRAFT_1041694 [Tuber brumale]|nr:hypothetical protein HOY80DRAFT_1041694 [Tuber brumale]